MRFYSLPLRLEMGNFYNACQTLISRLCRQVLPQGEAREA